MNKAEQLINGFDKNIKKHTYKPKHKYIHSLTKKYTYQVYMDKWVSEIERFANENYPSEVSKIDRAEVKIDVAIKSDGSFHAIRFLDYSGYKIIDDFVVSIIKGTAPFEPFPDTFKNEVDVLHIVRTWRFVKNLKSGNQSNKINAITAGWLKN